MPFVIDVVIGVGDKIYEKIGGFMDLRVTLGYFRRKSAVVKSFPRPYARGGADILLDILFILYTLF